MALEVSRGNMLTASDDRPIVEGTPIPAMVELFRRAGDALVPVTPFENAMYCREFEG